MVRRVTHGSFARASHPGRALGEDAVPLVSKVCVCVPRSTRPRDGAGGAVEASRRVFFSRASEDAWMAKASIADALEPHFVHGHVRECVVSRQPPRETREGTGERAGVEEEKEAEAEARRRRARFGLKTCSSDGGMTTRIDSEDVFCITPNGRFVASLMEDTAQAMGLQWTRDERGKASVSVNLTRDKFKVANRFHDRVGECARNVEEMHGKMDVVCAFEVDGRAVDVKFPPGARAVRLVKNVTRTTTRAVDFSSEEAQLLKDMKPPSKSEKKDIAVEDIERALEWCGRLVLGDEYLGGDAENRCDVVEVHEREGFMLHSEVERVIERARTVVNSDDDAPPWIVITALGFRDVPSNLNGVAMKTNVREKCAPPLGNVYLVVVFPGDRYVTFVDA